MIAVAQDVREVRGIEGEYPPVHDPFIRIVPSVHPSGIAGGALPTRLRGFCGFTRFANMPSENWPVARRDPGCTTASN